MKFILTACLVISSCYTVMAQAGTNLDVSTPGGSSGYGQVRFSNPTGNTGKVGDIDINEIKGTPYFNEKWGSATVVLVNNKQVKLNKARLNLYNNELHYVDALGIEMVVDDHNVKKVYLADAKDTAKIIATFSVAQNYNSKPGGTYLQVLNQGNVQLLKLNAMQLVKKDYDPLSGKTAYAFQPNASYVIAKGTDLLPCKWLNKADIFTALSPDAQANTWLTNNRNKLKSEKEVTAFFDWYNLNGGQ